MDCKEDHEGVSYAEICGVAYYGEERFGYRRDGEVVFERRLGMGEGEEVWKRGGFVGFERYETRNARV